MLNKYAKSFVLSLSLIFGGVANAGLITIDFESDAAGSQANGFVSDDATGVSFADSLGSELQLSNYGAQGDGQSLAVMGDDQSELVIGFDFLVSSLSLDFGNDDSGWTTAGDVALLTLFNGGVQVGFSTVVLNRDDIMNQSISFNGAMFDSATFVYANAQLQAINLIEIVDNIQFMKAATVSEPSTLAILALALAGFAARRAKK